jgi:phosphoribosylformylglycinamidine synthase
MSNNLNELSISNRESIEDQKKAVREIYIARKKELEVASSLDKVLEDELGIKGVTTNMYVRYLVDGLTDEEYKCALPTVFGELPVEDLMSAEEVREKEREQSVGTKKFNQSLNIESLPGQYDDVVDATQQCLMLQTGNQDHNVRAFTTIAFHGEISPEDMAKVKKYLINPVDKQHTDFSDKNLLRDIPSAENVKILDGFIDLSKK